MKELLWLKKWSHIISVSKIESEIGCAQKTIWYAMKGIRPFPSKWEEPLKKIIEEMRK